MATASIVRGVEAGLSQRRQDRQPAHAALCDVPIVHPLADAGLDQDPPGRRLDEQAVERLGQRRIGVQLVGHERLPDDARHGPEGGAGVGREPAGLDERDAHAAAEVGLPVDAVEVRHRSARRDAPASSRLAGRAYEPPAPSGPPLTARRSRSKSR